MQRRDRNAEQKTARPVAAACGPRAAAFRNRRHGRGEPYRDRALDGGQAGCRSAGPGCPQAERFALIVDYRAAVRGLAYAAVQSAAAPVAAAAAGSGCAKIASRREPAKMSLGFNPYTWRIEWLKWVESG